MIHPSDLRAEMAEELLGSPRADWARNCHAVSLALVRSRAVGIETGDDGSPVCRVARGSSPGVAGQHSWVVFSRDCYDPHALVLDLTLWSYDPTAPLIYCGRAHERPHTPHGSGSIYTTARPSSHGGEPIRLTPTQPLSGEAKTFLDMLGPLDVHGWRELASAPVGGWPAHELTTAMFQTDCLRPLVPIDLAGMRTDLNPAGLYLVTP
ncbi:MAG: hypothetical protein ACRDS9_28555 [Pseudonocardiaceae bacterium]